MKWKKDRDLLIAQTLAFVQSVTGKAAEDETRLEPNSSDEPAEIEPLPHDPVAPARPSPAASSEFREEIRRRVAAFRAHQELFKRDRDEYFKSVLARVRSPSGHASGSSSDQPVKR